MFPEYRQITSWLLKSDTVFSGLAAQYESLQAQTRALAAQGRSDALNTLHQEMAGLKARMYSIVLKAVHGRR